MTPAVGAGRNLARCAALLLVVLGLPIVDGLLGIPNLVAPPSRLLSDWALGIGLAIGVGIIASIAWKGPVRPLPWRGLELPTIVLAVLLPLAAAWWIFDRRPLLIDEVIQLWQARSYAKLHLSEPLPVHPEFWETLHIVEHNGRRFGQFPPGWPAMLALSVRAHAEWIVAPIAAGIGAIAWRSALRHLEPNATTRALALLLLACAPFAVFMAGSQMNHGPTLAAVLVGFAGLAALVEGDDAGIGAAICCGLGFGIAIAIRPLDGAAWGAPAGVWLVVLGARGRVAPARVVVAAIAGAMPVGLMLLVNAKTTGSPMVFGYQMLWGHTHDLGFHDAPWGPPHTPIRGLAQLSAYIVRLQDVMFESPVPAILPVAASLWLAPGLRALDRYLLAASALVGLGYLAYWHDGNFLGPRFVITLVPLMALWTARLPALVAARFGDGSKPWRATVGAMAFAIIFAITVNLPIRANLYRNGLVSMRWNLASMAHDGGVTNAIVFVRESWGAQLVARLWAQGASRPEADRLYRRIDACALDEALAGFEAVPVSDALRRLQAMTADSLKLRASPASPDTTERYLPGRPYSPLCQERVREDASGYLNLLPFLLVDDGNTYVRDLQARDTLIMREFPGRAPYVAVRSAPGLDASVRYLPLRMR